MCLGKGLRDWGLMCLIYAMVPLQVKPLYPEYSYDDFIQLAQNGHGFHAQRASIIQSSKKTRKTRMWTNHGSKMGCSLCPRFYVKIGVRPFLRDISELPMGQRRVQDCRFVLWFQEFGFDWCTVGYFPVVIHRLTTV